MGGTLIDTSEGWLLPERGDLIRAKIALQIFFKSQSCWHSDLLISQHLEPNILASDKLWHIFQSRTLDFVLFIYDIKWKSMTDLLYKCPYWLDWACKSKTCYSARRTVDFSTNPLFFLWKTPNWGDFLPLVNQWQMLKLHRTQCAAGQSLLVTLQHQQLAQRCCVYWAADHFWMLKFKRKA